MQQRYKGASEGHLPRGLPRGLLPPPGRGLLLVLELDGRFPLALLPLALPGAPPGLRRGPQAHIQVLQVALLLAFAEVLDELGLLFLLLALGARHGRVHGLEALELLLLLELLLRLLLVL